MKRTSTLLTLALLSLFAAHAHALPKQGNFDLSGTLSASYLEDAKNPVDLSFRLGIYYTDPLSLGFSSSYSISGKDPVFTTMLDARYHFYIDQQLVPYAGIQAGFANVDIDNDSDIAFGFGGHAGIAYYLQPNVSVYAQVFNNIYFAHGDTTHRGFGLGLAVLF